MTRIFRKVHFWKDHRTFMELEGNPPEIIKGYPKEGFVVVKIGEQSSIKSAFKLDVDEARCLRDQLNHFLRMHDIKHVKLLNHQHKKKDYTKYKMPYEERKEEGEKHTDSSEQKPFFLFSEEGEKRRKESEEKDETQFYF